MAQIQSYEALQDFLDRKKDEILNNYFVYYHLIQVIQALNEGKLELIDCYYVIGDNNNEAMVLKVTGNYFMYSDQWDADIINTLVQKIPFEKYKRFTFLGTRDLIIELLEKAGQPFEIIKDRMVYCCEKIIPATTPKIGITQNASFSDIAELTDMSMENYREEYDGKGEKTIEIMRGSVVHGIDDKFLFVLKVNNTVCSMVQIINDYSMHDPMIGNLFTKLTLRNKGYAYSLLHTVTEGLLNNGSEKCGLISDINNPASNKIFKAIGYEAIYKWIIVYINNTKLAE